MKLLILLTVSTAVLASDCGIHLPWLPRPWNAVPSRFERSIIGGRMVEAPGKWPWQVKIHDANDGFCGGTVISEQWILTAAHCIKNSNVPKSISSLVYFDRNATHIYDKLDDLPPAVRAIVHPDYSNDKIAVNDIALIKLERPLIYNDVVSSICLPNRAQFIPADGRAVATGFGKANNPGTNEHENMGLLREVMVPIVHPQDCENLWTVPGSHPVEEWRRAKLVCASSLTHGIHSGDSGGPLMMKSSDGRWFQVGIASFIKNARGRGDLFPAAFTDVRPYCDWIEEATEGEASCQKGEVILEDVQIQA